jgi:hypothetical protein
MPLSAGRREAAITGPSHHIMTTTSETLGICHGSQYTKTTVPTLPWLKSGPTEMPGALSFF